jgi:hypothetical protein
LFPFTLLIKDIGVCCTKDFKKVAITCLAFLVLFSVGCGSSAPSAPSSQQSTLTQQQQKPEQPSVKIYKSGHYKVGTDIPAGEYVGLSKGDAYIEVAKDSKGTLDSIIANDIFTNRTIITVSNGHYIKTQGAICTPSKMPPRYKAGMVSYWRECIKLA